MLFVFLFITGNHFPYKPSVDASLVLFNPRSVGPKVRPGDVHITSIGVLVTGCLVLTTAVIALHSEFESALLPSRLPGKAAQLEAASAAGVPYGRRKL